MQRSFVGCNGGLGGGQMDPLRAPAAPDCYSEPARRAYTVVLYQNHPASRG